jgi:ferredoxin-NADP reductase
VEERSPLCFLCGPEGFVEDLRGMLIAAGTPESDIRREQY